MKMVEKTSVDITYPLTSAVIDRDYVDNRCAKFEESIVAAAAGCSLASYTIVLLTFVLSHLL